MLDFIVLTLSAKRPILPPQTVTDRPRQRIANIMSKPDYMPRFYPEARFGGFTDIDGTCVFYMRVNALLPKEGVVLDVGCGRGLAAEDPIPLRRSLRTLKGKCGKVIGMDVDEAGRDNPLLDEFRPITGEHWPVDDASVDLCLVDNVLEHVANPQAFFAQAARVVRPGGCICIRTPNKWGYVAIAARIISNRHHARIVEKVQSGERKTRDVFPTLYRANTRGTLRRLMRRNDFESCVYGYESEPRYLGFSWPTYAFGVLHQKLAPRFMRLALFAFGRKKSQTP